MMRRLAIILSLALAPGLAAATPFGAAISACWGTAPDVASVAAALEPEGWTPTDSTGPLASAVAMVAPFQTDRPAAEVAAGALDAYAAGLPAAADRVAAGAALQDRRGNLLLVERGPFALTCTFAFDAGTNAALVNRDLPPVGQVIASGPMRSAQVVPDNFGAHGVLWRPDMEAYAATGAGDPVPGPLLLTTSALQR